MAMEELRRGDLVEVRSPAEILATLDEQGTLARLPFMPEMALLCGKRFHVERRAERVCDTVNYTGTRRPAGTVYLDDLRCDGAAHDGCQAECRFFWKEEWLRRVSASDPGPAPVEQAALEALLGRVSLCVKRTLPGEQGPEERWRCQATDLPAATEHVRFWDLRSYVRELTCGNVSLGHFLGVTARAAVQEPLRKLGLINEVHLVGSRTQPVRDPPLHLQPGERVRVRSQDEIARTLSPQGRSRGLWFDREMAPYCGRVFSVRRRVTRFIDDHDGKMVVLKSDCVTLEGVVCSGDLSHRRWFCGRAIFPYWREAWLERVEAPEPASAGPRE